MNKEKCVVLSISLLIVVIMLEAGLRLLDLPLTSSTHMPCLYREDPETGYLYEPKGADWLRRNVEINNHVEMNSEGFHDVEHNALKPAHTKRIMVIGDSFVAANHVSVAEGWTQTLQAELNKKYQGEEKGEGEKRANWEVINLGLDGIATDAEEILLRRYLEKYHPDIVLLAFYTNDIEGLEVKIKYRICYRDNVLIYQTAAQKQQLMNFVDAYQPGKTMVFFYNHVYIVRVVSTLVERFSSRIPSTTTVLVSNFLSPSRIGAGRVKEEKDLKDLRAILFRIRHFASVHNTRLVLLPVPAKDNLQRSYNDLKSKLSGEDLKQFEKLLVFDTMEDMLLQKDMEYRELFWEYDGHFNRRGYRAFGEAVARELERGIQQP